MNEIEIKKASKLAFWPSPQDYNEAVQNLHANSEDAELQKSLVTTNQLGLPLPMTGAFASVYRAVGEKREFALRCFLRDIADQQERYSMISKFVLGDSLPYTVDFDFLSRGIRVNGHWFPILKMDFVEGTALDLYVRQNLSNTTAIADCAENFKTMCLALRDAGIAHGDLQHGNLLITNISSADVSDNGLRLVDYDGMFVPGMEGMSANELGHPNYQHPRRSATTFDANLDSFSQWIIYASLRAIALDSSIATELQACDDCLLFRRADFVEPEHSYTFATLEQSKHPEIVALSRFIRWQVRQTPSAVPPLGSDVEAIGNLPPIKSVERPARSATGWDTPVQVDAPIIFETSSAAPATSFSGASTLPMPKEYLTSSQRRTRFADRSGNTNPWILQFGMVMNPVLWWLVLMLAVTIPQQSELISKGVDQQARVVLVIPPTRGGQTTYEYEYGWHGYTYRGSVKVDRDNEEKIHLTDGGPINVRFLPNAPGINVADATGNGLESAARQSLFWLQMGGFALLAANLACEFLIWSRPLRHRRLIRLGSVARGRILKKVIKTGSKGVRQFEIEYSFQTKSGTTAPMVFRLPSEQFEFVQSGQEIFVFYDPANPADNLPAQFALYEPVSFP